MDEPFFGSEPLEIDSDADIELEAEIVAPVRGRARAAPPAASATAKPSGDERRESAPVAPVRSPTVEPVDGDAVEVVAARVVAALDELPPSASSASSAPGELQGRPVVVIDPDAAVLEWIKASIEGRFAATGLVFEGVTGS